MSKPAESPSDSSGSPHTIHSSVTIAFRGRVDAKPTRKHKRPESLRGASHILRLQQRSVSRTGSRGTGYRRRGDTALLAPSRKFPRGEDNGPRQPASG